MTERREKLDRPAVYADLLSLPEGVRGEIIDGELFVQPRPRARYSRAASRLMSKLEGPFHDGDDGPGGWWIVQQPGIELPGCPEVAPDLAGWRRERMPEHHLDAPAAVIGGPIDLAFARFMPSRVPASVAGILIRPSGFVRTAGQIRTNLPNCPRVTTPQSPGTRVD